MGRSLHKDAGVLNNVSNVKQNPSVCLHVLREIADDVRLRRTATALADAGWQVTVVDVTSSGSDSHDVRTKTIRTSAYALQHVPATFDFQSERFASRQSLKILLLLIHTVLVLLKQPTDIYHACEWTALPACSLAALIHRKPLIFEAYELPLQDHVLIAKQRGRRLLYAFLHLYLAYVLPRCAAVITVSPPIVAEMQSRYHLLNVTLIRNIPHYQATQKTNYLREHLHLSAQTRIALYQGNIQPDRGLDCLVRAATYLAEDCVLVIMGENIGKTQLELEQLSTLLHVENKVKFIAAVPYESLLAWTSSANIGLVLIPLNATKNMRMCLPNKLFEYIQAGLPVLSSPLPQIQQLLERYNVGRAVPSLAPTEVGAAINALLNNPTEMQAMHNSALQAAQQDLCWTKESQQLIKIYQRVMLTRF